LSSGEGKGSWRQNQEDLCSFYAWHKALGFCFGAAAFLRGTEISQWMIQANTSLVLGSRQAKTIRLLSQSGSPITNTATIASFHSFIVLFAAV
jgi:hypothetical protein